MRLSLNVPPDFSFHETLAAHGWRRLLPFVWQEETQTLERVERMADSGSVYLMRLRAAGDDAVEVTVSGETNAAEAAEKARRMLQLDLPLSGFHAFCRARPELCSIAEKRQGRMLVSPTLWEDVVKVICTTNTTWAQTIAMTARFVNGFGSPWPRDPARHAFPDPAQIAAVPFADFAAEARLGYRAGAVHTLASQIAEGALSLEDWRAETDAAELRRRLLSLRGVGPYAAACLMLYLGRPERVNADSWARTLLAKELGRPVTDSDIHAFFEPHGEWRGLVYTFYPWASG